MKILIATDAWLPQVNGVVTTLRNTVRELESAGHIVKLITADGFRTFACPTYPEVRLAIAPGSRVSDTIEAFAPDAIHVATEAPLGAAVRKHCLRAGYQFTTAYHTQFPEYIHARCRLPVAVTYGWMRRFHSAAAATMVATPTVQERLEARGFRNVVRWSRGVDTDLFKPAPRKASGVPIFLYTGRVAVEKNIEDFLRLQLPGIKWVVGDGPARKALQLAYPDAVFHGMRHGNELAHFYQQADVFVFPSKTDTFGLVLIEAMACGTPVVAYPVTGPADVVLDSNAGILSHNLRTAAIRALRLDRAKVRDYGMGYSWSAATRQFLANLRPAREPLVLEAA